MRELPEGWEATTIGEVITDFETTDPRKEPDKTFKYIDIGSIDNQTQTIIEAKEFSGSQAPSRARRIVETGDVLFSTVRTYLRNIAQVPEQMHDYLTSTGIAVLRPSEAVEPGYLFKWVNNSVFVDAISFSQTGALYPAVKDAQVKDGAIPLPPLAEQRRIVAKLDQLSARTRAAKDHLAHVQTLATRAKQATLAAAFRGELLGLEKVPTDQVNDRRWNLPEGWAWKRFEEVATIKSNLRPPS